MHTGPLERSVQQGRPLAPSRIVMLAVGMLLDLLLLGWLLDHLVAATAQYFLTSMIILRMGVMLAEIVAGVLLAIALMRPMSFATWPVWVGVQCLPGAILGLPPSSLEVGSVHMEGWWEFHFGVGQIPHLISYPPVQVIALLWAASCSIKFVWTLRHREIE